MRIVAIVQARVGSTRFPNKVMQPICGTPMIGLLLMRMAAAKLVDQIVLATSEDARNEPRTRYVRELGYAVYHGSEKDVLDRCYRAAQEAEADAVVRITGDCPLIDPVLVDAVISNFLDSGVDYATNTSPPTYPDGLDIEVFTFRAMETAWNQAKKHQHREHVTPFIRESGQFSQANFPHATDHSNERWTVDEPEDFEVVKKIFEHFHPRRAFGWLEVLALRNEHPEWFMANQHLSRNEGLKLGTGQKLWKRAKRVIPGGNMLLSKRAEMFLPEQWPSYYSRVKGAEVWDLDGNKYIDMSCNGIGACILGAADPDVDVAVKNAIDSGTMSTLNCPEEVELAELLCEIHPWAEMVRYARTGGESMAIAVRIARARTGRDTIAFCGYHGWSDWYLAANLAGEKALDGHLIAGLSPTGVPRGLIGSILPFHYNKIEELEGIVSKQGENLAAIVMEPIRSEDPATGFLEGVREIASSLGAALIFDEITSGFRLSTGGAHLLYDVTPDIAVFGKAISNGYPMAAIIGTADVMQAAQDSFISSTYWTERIGPTAALSTIRKHRRCNVSRHLIEIGSWVKSIWSKAARVTGLPLEVSGMNPLGHFTFITEDAQALRTLFTQLMLERGFLASNAFYVTYAHNDEHIEEYRKAVEEVFDSLAGTLDRGEVRKQLKGPIAHTGFQRLT